MKQCGRCKLEKPLEEFNFKRKALGTRQKSCKSCTRLELRQHYSQNKTYYIKKARKRNIQNKQIVKKFIWEYLIVHPCVDCGEPDPIVLDFDHQGDKIDSVSGMMRNYFSLETIQKEIKKCEVRCANCHRRKTAKEFGWHKNTLPL